ncbi:MAG: inositol monophosphatase family protein [Sulfurimonadaceae bacterium]|nr:inositol monophosphatase family protein [Sulfurimonadaceae bacterium]
MRELIASNTDESAYQSFEQGAGGDISIGFDLMAESVFVKYLKPFGTVCSEESGCIEGPGDAEIVIDPIDGSDNLKSNFPYYGAAIALRENGKTVAAVISNFANGDAFVKHASTHYQTHLSDLNLCKAVTPNPYAKVGLFEKAPAHPELSRALIEEGLKFRSPGAIALSLSYAYHVKYVIFFGTMRSYDIDAGYYMCEDLYRFQDDELLIVAKDQEVFDRLLKVFKR